MENINTKENWDKYHTIHPGNLNYPEKFKFISRELLKFIPEDAKILELGSGYCYLLKQIKDDHPNLKIEGFEMSKVAVDIGIALGLSIKEGTAPADLKQYPDCSYDVIIATEFLEHFDNEPRLEVIKEVYRILKKNGKAIFTVPDNIMPPSEEAFHLICYDLESFKKFLSSVFDFCGVSSRKYLVSDRPIKGIPGHCMPQWGEAPFLFGIGYKT